LKSALYLTAASAIALAGLTGTSYAAPMFTVQDVIDPASPGSTMLFGINNSGTIVGANGANAGVVVSPKGVVTDVNVPGATQTQLTGIASNGDRSGIFVGQNGTTNGFIQFAHQSGAVAVFDQPGTAFNQALGISSNSKMFAGYSSTNPGGAVLQQAYVGSVQNHTFTDISLPANFNSQATGINNRGVAVGFFDPTATTSVGFADINGIIKNIDPFGSHNTAALGISDTGEIVGTFTDANGVQHGYIDINGVFTVFDPTGSMNTTINGVNDRGQIVGFFTNGDNQVIGFEGTPGHALTLVPEPGALAILGVGLLGLIGVARRRTTTA
jgi:probable HAF family extracellular repeat protein